MVDRGDSLVIALERFWQCWYVIAIHYETILQNGLLYQVEQLPEYRFQVQSGINYHVMLL